MKFNILQLAQYRGGALFRDVDSPKTCSNQSPSTSACKLESLYTEREACIDCHEINSEKLIMRTTFLGRTEVSCRVDSNPPVIKRNPTSSHFSNYYTGCELYQRPSGGSCTSCHSNCVSCYGNGATKCLACDWDLNVRKTLTGRCQACSSTQFSVYGSCASCQGSCSSGCPNGVCASCSATQNLFHEVCCAKNQYSDGSVCSSCHTSCATCFQGGANGCLSCTGGGALNKFTNQCIGGCDLSEGKFLDHLTNTCTDCPTGCKECSGVSSCSVCYQGYTKDNSSNQCNKVENEASPEPSRKEQSNPQEPSPEEKITTLTIEPSETKPPLTTTSRKSSTPNPPEPYSVYQIPPTQTLTLNST